MRPLHRFYRLRLRCGRGQITRLTNGIKALTAMRSVAKRLVPGKAAAAKANSRASPQTKLFPICINHREIAFQAKRTVIKYCSF